MSDQWINQIVIRSETSSRVYTVSQHRERRHWACSCPGYRTHRKCKHLRAMGLPEKEVPFEREKPKPAFMDVYQNDSSTPAGNSRDWRNALNSLDEAESVPAASVAAAPIPMGRKLRRLEER